MKEAFWKVDPQSGYRFSDRTNPNQAVLFRLDPSQDVVVELQRHFAGKSIPSDDVFCFVEDQTAYTKSHAKDALKFMEQKGAIQVMDTKTDGSKRRRGTFPEGVRICFTQK